MTEIQTWEKNPFTMSAASLAYMGDAVYEVMVREMLVREGVRQPSVASLQYVTATAQCRMLEAIQSLLTEPETEMYRRGRNCVHNMPPKSCTMAEYRRATGLETLFGYLWLAGERERLHTLFQTGVDALRSVTQ